MKRPCTAVLLLIICMLSITGVGEENILPQFPEVPLYEAVSNVDFHLRRTPEDNSRRIKEVESHVTLLVYDYGLQWCAVTYENVTGYCKTKWLYRFRSLKPFDTLIPGYPVQIGIAKVMKPIHVEIPSYDGNDLSDGNVLSIYQYDKAKATILMMRSSAEIPVSALEFIPFVSWSEAKSGDLIGGYTTYYNRNTGGRLSGNRQWNIELACQRISDAVVTAGSTFSYNAICAPYTKANGYKMAPNISSDGEGYGGGVCQVTTTLYNAVLGLPLQVE